MCNACMRMEAWKMLFGNLIFILGVPVAVLQLFRAYTGGSTFSKSYAGLDRANALAHSSKHDQAAEVYEQIEKRVGACANVRMNHGRALLAARRVTDAALPFELALADCANFSDAAAALALCYEQLGRTEDLNTLQAQWSDEDDEQQIEEVGQAPLAE